jgi:hypothetical protein
VQAAKKPDGRSGLVTPATISKPTPSQLPIPPGPTAAPKPTGKSPKSSVSDDDDATRTPSSPSQGKRTQSANPPKYRSPEPTASPATPDSGTGVYTTAQIRERVSTALSVIELPEHVVAAFVSDVQSRPDRDTICSSTANVIKYYTAWRESRRKYASVIFRRAVEGCLSFTPNYCVPTPVEFSEAPVQKPKSSYVVNNGVVVSVSVPCEKSVFCVCVSFAGFVCV